MRIMQHAFSLHDCALRTRALTVSCVNPPEPPVRLAMLVQGKLRRRGISQSLQPRTNLSDPSQHKSIHSAGDSGLYRASRDRAISLIAPEGLGKPPCQSMTKSEARDDHDDTPF